MNELYATIQKVRTVVAPVVNFLNPEITENRISIYQDQSLINSSSNKQAELMKSIFESEKKENIPYFSLNTWKEFKDFSIELALYFTILKQLIGMMFIISLVSIAQLYLNYTGEYYKDSQVQSVLDRFSIGNFYGVRQNSSETLNSEKMEKNYKIYCIVDVFISAFFLISVVFFLIQTYRTKIQKTPKLSDVSLQVHNIPSRSNREEIEDYIFRKFGIETIIKLEIVELYGALLKLYETRQSLITKINSLNEKNPNIDKKSRSYRKLDEKLNENEKRIKNFKSKRELLYYENVFITFFNSQDRSTCLEKSSEIRKKATQKKMVCFGSNSEQDEALFKGSLLVLKPAKEPSDIIWENLHYSRTSRFCRMLFSLVITFLILTLSISMIYYVKTTQSRIPDDKTCAGFDFAEKGDSESGNKRLCYCKSLKTKELLNNSKTCKAYIELLSYAWSIKFLSAFGIILVNFFLRVMMRKLTSFEKPKCISFYQKRVFLKIFFVIFINTAILIYLVNLKIPYFTDYVLGGQFDDFNREWFLNVGNSILALMLISLFSPHLIYLIFAYPIFHFIKKRKLKKKEIFNRPVFDLTARTAQVMNVLFTCFLYSGGLPILNWICLFYLIIIFWTDRWLVIRHFRRPSKNNETLYLTLLRVLPVGGILHSCFSLYTLGGPSIISVDPIDLEYPEVFTPDLAVRMGRLSGLAHCCVIIFGFLVLLIVNISKSCYNRFCKVDNNVSFESIKNKKDEVLSSYDISRNSYYESVAKLWSNEYAVPIEESKKLEDPGERKDEFNKSLARENKDCNHNNFAQNTLNIIMETEPSSE